MMIKTPREFFENILPNRFKPDKAAGLETVIQMNITGSEGGDWTIVIKDQKLHVREGNDPSAAIGVQIADTDFVDLINGKLSGINAFLTGRLQFKGSMSLAMKLMDMGIV